MDLDSAIPFEVLSYEELARWIVSSSQSQHGTLYLVNHNDTFILCTLTSFTGYYNYTGLPVLLFCTLDQEPSGSFLRIDVRSDSKNKISFTDGFDENDSNLGFIQYIPIIRLKNVPSIFTFEV